MKKVPERRESNKVLDQSGKSGNSVSKIPFLVKVSQSLWIQKSHSTELTLQIGINLKIGSSLYI